MADSDRKRPLKPDYEERAEIITSELENRSHVLVLEETPNHYGQCRAKKYCKVQEYQETNNICSWWRLALIAQPMSWVEAPRRFHVSCLEAMDVDVAKYLSLPLGKVPRPSKIFHPSIIDWIARRGKAFEPRYYELYGYEDALDKYKKELDDLIRGHGEVCLPQLVCVCKPSPTLPNSQNFIAGEPSRCKLSEVLLSVKHEDHPWGADWTSPILVLEVGGRRWERAEKKRAKERLKDADENSTNKKGDDVDEDAELKRTMPWER